MGLQRGIKGSREREVNGLAFVGGKELLQPPRKSRVSIIHHSVRKATVPSDEDSDQAKGKK